MKTYIALTLLLFVAGTLGAQTRPLQRGDVILETTYCFGICIAIAEPRIFMDVVAPNGETIHSNDVGMRSFTDGVFAADRGIYAPAPDQIFFTRIQTLYATSDLQTIRRLYDWGNGIWLGEIAPMRNGHLLVASPGEARVYEITPGGAIVTVHNIAEWHDGIELLADQCTLLYAARGPDVGRYNICTRSAEPDFAAVPRGAATSIRQLPNRDVLVAARTEVVRFSPRGEIVHVYPIPATLIALTPDAGGFWTAGGFEGGVLRRLDFARPDAPFLARTYTETPRGLAVIGEWRASAQQPRARTVRK